MLLPYSERHFQRLDRLLQSSYLVEHTLASMQMLVAEGGPAGDSNKAAAGTQPNRPLVRELKRLRDDKPRQEEEGEGVDRGAESHSEGEDKIASPVPVSEVVDGRVVFNVRVENGGTGDSDSEDEDNDLQESDVVMGDASKRDPSVVEVGGGEGSAKKPKKKRKKKSSSGASAPTTLGLVGQPVVEAVVPAAGVEVASASGDKKARKKRRRSAGDANNVAGASPALVKVQKQSVGAVVPEEGEAVAETVEDGGGSGKKKKKKRSGKGRRKSTTT